MSSTLSRRALVAAAAVMPATTLPALALESPDAELLRLGEEFDRHAATTNECFRQSALTLAVAKEMFPAIPDSLQPRTGDRKLGLRPPESINVGRGLYGHNDVPYIRKLDNPGAREIVRDYDAWSQGHHEAMERSGHLVAEKALEEMFDQTDIIEQIIATPAHTIEGMQVKARALYWIRVGDVCVYDEEPQHEQMLCSLLCDLVEPQGLESMDDKEYHERYVMKQQAQ
jgi:hypothetical protein